MVCKCRFTYFRRKLEVFLSVYVGDFKLAGVARKMTVAWQFMTTNGLTLDEPQPFGQYLISWVRAAPDENVPSGCN